MIFIKIIRIRIRNDPSILRNPYPDLFGQKSTDSDPDQDPSNPGLNIPIYR